MMDDYYDSEPSIATDGSLGDPWVTQFCEMTGHQYFCEVSFDFMEDEFNLTGLSALVPRYKEALELVLDLEPEAPVPLADVPTIQENGELLYGLIHARYIITRAGLQAMWAKYECHDFGVCPRYYCKNTGVLPIGRHDLPGFETVRLYCPCCRDIYVPSNVRFLNIDGAFFGSSFPAMFLEMFPEIESECIPHRQEQFALKVFGFKISELSKVGPRMKWLREFPGNDTLIQEEEEEEEEDASMDQP